MPKTDRYRLDTPGNTRGLKELPSFDEVSDMPAEDIAPSSVDEVVFMSGCVGYDIKKPEAVLAWTRRQCREVVGWLARIHLRASDNYVRLKPQPSHSIGVLEESR